MRLCLPHAAIRPVLVTEEEKAAAPATFETIPAKGPGLEKYTYRIQVSPYDCLGCGCCVNACLAKDGALTLKPAESQAVQAENWTYGIETVPVKKDAVNVKTVKGSQFAKPYYEFPPACAGCGETAYIKLVTQLFGDRMYIANASGCTAAHGGSLPSTPYCTDDRGFGPPWEQSLFETTPSLPSASSTPTRPSTASWWMPSRSSRTPVWRPRHARSIWPARTMPRSPVR